MKRISILIFMLASVAVGGAWRAHVASPPPAASLFPPVPTPTSPRKIDEYGNLRWSDERARLDNYIIELRNDQTMHACIICYGGRRGREGEAHRRCARAADYVRRVGGIEAERIVTIDGGYREELTVELWPAPAGATLPTASPTVDPSEVVISKSRPRRTRLKR